MTSKTQDELTQELINKTQEHLFNEYPGLFSISWMQFVNPENTLDIDITIDCPHINEHSYQATLTKSQKEEIKIEFYKAFEDLDTQSLISIFGANVKVTLLQDTFEIESI